MQTDNNNTEIELLAIDNLKTGWGQLFMRAENGTPYGEFIGKRPYPTQFWQQVDIWIKGYTKAQSENQRLQSLNDELKKDVELFKNAHNMECTVTNLQRDEMDSLKEKLAAVSFDLQCAATDKLELEQRNDTLVEALDNLLLASLGTYNYLQENGTDAAYLKTCIDEAKAAIEANSKK